MTNKENLPKNRDGLWKLIRHYKSFTARQIQGDSQMSRPAVMTYLNQLTKLGFLDRQKIEGKISYRYTLVKDKGLVRPDLLMKTPNSYEKIWMALKPLKSFTHLDISLVAETRRFVTKDYLTALCQVGILKPIVTRHTDPKKPTVYKLVKAMDHGPRAPQLKSDGRVYDPNINQMLSRIESEAA